MFSTLFAKASDTVPSDPTDLRTAAEDQQPRRRFEYALEAMARRM